MDKNTGTKNTSIHRQDYGSNGKLTWYQWEVLSSKIHIPALNFVIPFLVFNLFWAYF